jgi:glycosyltransferase A (GT-A) superfamily protein (DUF2064 family)
MTTVIVIAKETVPGKVKTRLHPPFSLEQAAELAAASLADTLEVVGALGATETILYFDGTLVPVGAAAFRVVPQVQGSLDERLAAVFDLCSGPTLLVGMDTPQITERHLAAAVGDWTDDIDAWFGPATDGGFWALGLRAPSGDLIRGVPMSCSNTGVLQLGRLVSAGLKVRMLPPLTDVDTIDSAFEVAAVAPQGRFAAALATMDVREPIGARS